MKTGETGGRPRLHSSLLLSFFYAPVPPVPGLVGRNGLIQFRLVKVRPQGVCGVELRIGALPQEEVGDPLLPAGTDDEIRIRDAQESLTGKQKLYQSLGVAGGIFLVILLL